MIEMPCINCRANAKMVEQESSDFHCEFAEITFKCSVCGHKIRLIYTFDKLEEVK